MDDWCHPPVMLLLEPSQASPAPTPWHLRPTRRCRVPLESRGPCRTFAPYQRRGPAPPLHTASQSCSSAPQHSRWNSLTLALDQEPSQLGASRLHCIRKPWSFRPARRYTPKSDNPQYHTDLLAMHCMHLALIRESPCSRCGVGNAKTGYGQPSVRAHSAAVVLAHPCSHQSKHPPHQSSTSTAIE